MKLIDPLRSDINCLISSYFLNTLDAFRYSEHALSVQMTWDHSIHKPSMNTFERFRSHEMRLLDQCTSEECARTVYVRWNTQRVHITWSLFSLWSSLSSGSLWSLWLFDRTALVVESDVHKRREMLSIRQNDILERNDNSSHLCQKIRGAAFDQKSSSNDVSPIGVIFRLTASSLFRLTVMRQWAFQSNWDVERCSCYCCQR
jgi:hypothetical protein